MLDSLPDVLVQLVLQKLPLYGLLRTARSNRRLLSLADSAVVWKRQPMRKVFVSSFPTLPPTLSPLLLRHMRIHLVWHARLTPRLQGDVCFSALPPVHKLTGTPERHDWLAVLRRPFTAPLRDLTLSMGSVHESEAHELASLLTGLHHLHTLSFTMPTRGAAQVVLEQLRSSPALTSLTIKPFYNNSHNARLSLIAEFAHLQSLSIGVAFADGDDFVRLLTTEPFCGRLQQLTLGNFDGAMATSADYSRCFAALSNLTSLNLLCPRFVNAVLPSVSSAPSLLHVEISATVESSESAAARCSLLPSIEVIARALHSAPRLHLILELGWLESWRFGDADDLLARDRAEVTALSLTYSQSALLQPLSSRVQVVLGDLQIA